MKKRRLSCEQVLWIVGVGLPLLGCFRQPKNDMNAEPGFPLEVSAEDLDLGWIYQGSLSSKIEIFNVSRKQVELTQIAGSCGCLAVETLPLTLPPGGRRDVRITLDVPTASYPHNKSFRTRLLPVVKGYRSVAPVWELKGRVRQLVTVSPELVRFKEGLVRGRPFPGKDVEIACATPLASLEVEGGEGMATLRMRKASETLYILSIQPLSTLPPGSFSFSVTLTACLPSNETIRITSPKVLGWVSQEVAASPRALHWGAVPVGRRLKSCVALRSLVGKPFTIESVIPDSSDTEVRWENLGDGDKKLYITHHAVATGEQEHKLLVRVAGDGAETLDLTIKLRYCGVKTHDQRSSPRARLEN